MSLLLGSAGCRSADCSGKGPCIAAQTRRVQGQSLGKPSRGTGGNAQGLGAPPEAFHCCTLPLSATTERGSELDRVCILPLR